MSGTESGVQLLENGASVKLSQDWFYHVFGCNFSLEATFGEEAENRKIEGINCGVGSLCRTRTAQASKRAEGMDVQLCA